MIFISNIRDRTSNHLPAVLLTLQSIIQAISLDMLWTHTTDIAVHDQFSALAVLGWMQILATLLILIVVWMSFVSLLMRFIWVPALLDTALPILVGILQFALIEFARPENLALWLFTLGVLMLVIAIVNHRYFKKARLDPRNADFFGAVPPATWRDFFLLFIYVATFFVGGLFAVLIDLHVMVEIAMVLIVMAGLGHFVFEQNRFWNLSLFSSDSSAD